MKELVEMIAEEVGVSVIPKINPEFVRPNDNKEIVGSAYKIESELGWKRKYKFKDTVEDMVKYMEKNK